MDRNCQVNLTNVNYHMPLLTTPSTSSYPQLSTRHPWSTLQLSNNHYQCQTPSLLSCVKWGRQWGVVIIIRLKAHMGHQDQDGEKVGQISLCDWKLEAATDREKQKFIHFQVLLSNLVFLLQLICCLHWPHPTPSPPQQCTIPIFNQ